VSTLTDCIQTAETVLDLLAAKLGDNIAGLGIYRYSPTSYEALFKRLPLVNTPAAVLVWQGAEFNKEPGRPERVYHRVAVLVLTQDGQSEDGAAAARVLAWEILRLLDDYTSGDVWARCMDIAAVDLDEAGMAPTVSCYAVTLEVSDH